MVELLIHGGNNLRRTYGELDRKVERRGAATVLRMVQAIKSSMCHVSFTVLRDYDWDSHSSIGDAKSV